ncbi:MAG: hypothetical protein MI924_20645, partial [Chloroflexales bacterium]|nr:hypothetical protein [Chloroflexales bacterium]
MSKKLRGFYNFSQICDFCSSRLNAVHPSTALSCSPTLRGRLAQAQIYGNHLIAALPTIYEFLEKWALN